jgi:hypothetical protein
MGRRIASGPRFLAGRLRSTVGLIVLLTPLTGFVDAARAATCNPADAGEVKAAIAEIERSLDPCGESAEVRDVLHQFSQCAARGFRICTDRRSERNFIERADGVADGVHATITWNPALRTELEWGCNGDPTRAVRRDPAASLLHELVHAMRFTSGVFRYSPMGGGYGNNEEFYANTIEMIYRSEKGLPIYDYGYHSFDPASFLERNMAIVLLTDLRVAQQSLFDALAHVDAPFNPIKQLDDRRRKLQGG